MVGHAAAAAAGSAAPKGFAVPFPMAIMNAAAAAAATLGSPPLATPPKVPLSAFMDAPAPLAMPPE